MSDDPDDTGLNEDLDTQADDDAADHVRAIPQVPNKPSNAISRDELYRLDSIDRGDFKTHILKTSTFWNVVDGGNAYYASPPTATKIEPGLYKANWRERTGPVLVKQIIATDKLVDIEDSVSTYVVDQIEDFWNKKEEFRKRGFLHKRGVLMHGDPGSGKTSTIQILIQKLIKKKGIVIYPTGPDITGQCLQMLRQIEKDTPIILVLEDFETLIKNPKEEGGWLALLDGETQVDNIVFLGTTNYPEDLDKRFGDRPSRFDVVVQVEMPSAAMRRAFIMEKEPSVTGEELEYWVQKTDTLSIAHIKELIVAVKCLGHDVDETLTRLKDMRERKLSSMNHINKRTKVGFG